MTGPGPTDRKRPRRRIGEMGDVEVFVADEQTTHDIDVDRYARLSHLVLEAEGVRGDVEMSLLFVEQDFISALNGTHMGVTGSTDVLAFPIDDHNLQAGRSPDNASRRPPKREPMNDPGPLLLGDVVVCPSVAQSNAVANVGSYAGHGGELIDEVDLLVVHGILHILGMDHAEDDERRQMQAAERQHLAAFRNMTGEPSG